MGMRALRVLPLLVLPAAVFALLAPGETANHPRDAIRPGGGELAFEPAAGRFGEDIRFLARAQGMTLYIRDGGSSVVVAGKHESLVTTSLVGARPTRATAVGRLRGRVNSYVGPRDRWRTGLPTFAEVRAADVYPGVDLAYHGRSGRLESDFKLAPGADPAQIIMRVTGGRNLRLDRQGNLVVGHLRQLRPAAFQGGRRVPAGFDLHGDEVRFRLGAYDHTRPLLIDPQLAYSSYLGGTADDNASGVAIDSAGNAYVTGQTGSTDFPGSGSSQGFDAFLTKVAPDGKTRVYSTYYGGSDTDDSYGVGVDSSGNAFIGGHTTSTDLPGRSTGMQPNLAGGGDGYVAKFDASGALVRASYLGGTSPYDFVFGIALDSSGNPYVTGEASSSDFPTGPGPTMQAAKGSGDTQPDAFVTKFSSTLQARTYSTYLGGLRDDYGNGIAVGPDGSAYVTGYTRSSDFPRTNAYDDYLWVNSVDPQPPIPPAEGFVTRLAPNGASRVYSTFIGGDAFDQGRAIAVDSSGSAYVIGDTSSNGGDPHLTPGGGFQYSGPAGPLSGYAGGGDAMIFKFTPDGSAIFAWWYGGGNSDSGRAVAFDDQGNAYFAGRTLSADLPTSDGVPQPQIANAATEDGWIMKLSSDRALTYATYLGASNYDSVEGIAVDPRGSAYLVGDSYSSNFPVTADPMQIDNAGGSDAWFAKLIISRASIDSGPEGTLRGRDASFTYSSIEPNSSLNCRLSPSEAAFSKCPRSGKSYTGLADGAYTFEVSTTDYAGTTSDAVARAFTVDTRPIADFAIAPNPALAGRTVTFDGNASSGAGVALTKFEWDTDGDGSFERDTGATPSTTAVFPSPRTLQISLRVTDAEGKTAAIAKELRVTSPPTGSQFGVTINKGARWTNSPDVTVSANFPASTTALLFSNDGGFLAPSEFPAQPTVRWKLDSSGPERLPKTIYVRFLSGPIVSETHQDDIILDETPPKVQQAVVAPTGSAARARATRLARWKVRVKATDRNSGVGRVQVTANKRKPGKLLKYKRRLVVRSGKRPRWVRARDRAGNFSKWRRARR